MASEVETLAEFVKRVRRDKKLSLSEVEAASKRRGGGISNGYISQIENGQNTNPSVSALKGLAAGLDISEDELFDVARGKAPSVRSVLVSATDVADRLKRTELMALLFDDIPDDCQFDTLASMVGVHARRGQSLRIFQRSGARSEAFIKIARLISELLPIGVELTERSSAEGKDGTQEQEGVAIANAAPNGASDGSNSPRPSAVPGKHPDVPANTPRMQPLTHYRGQHGQGQKKRKQG